MIYKVNECSPVPTKMAILSRWLIVLAILVYEPFIHLTQINLCPTRSLRLLRSVLLSHFKFTPGFNCIVVTRRLSFDKNIYMNMNYGYWNTVYERKLVSIKVVIPLRLLPISSSPTSSTPISSTPISSTRVFFVKTSFDTNDQLFFGENIINYLQQW